MIKGGLILISLLILSISIANATTDIKIASTAGDYIGGGMYYQYSDSDATITMMPYTDLVTISINQASTGQYWSLNFKTPGNFIRDGYFHALRYPFQGPLAPGLSITGNGRGCNQLAGRFVVHEIVVNNNVVQQLAVDFQQFCDTSGNPLNGSVRVNSAVPAPYEQPVASAGPDTSFVEDIPMGLSARDSYSELGYELSYQWSQLSGSPITIMTPNAASTSLVGPTNLDLGGENYAFQVVVTDITGASASDTVNIHIASKSDPQTYLYMSSYAGGDFFQRVDWLYDLNNAQFSVSNNFANGVSARVTASNTWNLDFAPVQGNDLVPGHYEIATRFPFQSVTEPGMNVSGYGFGCNTLTGMFDVISNDGIGSAPNSFLVMFYQVCDVSGTLLRGSLSVNALDPRVPFANAGTLQTAVEFNEVTLDGTASTDSDGFIESYLWTQVEGTTVLLSDASASQPTFMAPSLPEGKLSDTLRFELLVTDDQGFKAKNEVSITLMPGNQAPIANDDQATTYKRELVDIAVLNNDSDDLHLDVTTVRIVNQPSHGTINISDKGIVTYRPARRFIGTDTFIYTVDDNEGKTSNPATVTVNVISKP